jgi:dolichol-phosphate mannosyltransferase
VRKKVLQNIRLKGDYGEYFMDLMFRAILKRHSFVEIPYFCVPRKAGESKTAPNIKTLIKRGVKYLWMIVRLQGVRLKNLL